nr:uncharacterized protein LOC4346364 isoform X2 [Oryza sativa Japonica Group]
MAPTLPVVPAHGEDKKKKKKKKKPLKPSQEEEEALPLPLPPPDRKRKKASEPVNSPERAKKKKTATPHEPPSAKQQKRPLPFQRTWSPNDEVLILEAMAAHRQEHGKVPTAAELFPVLNGRLDRKRLTYKKLADKLRTFMRRHGRDAKNGPPTQAHDRRLYDLSRNVWVSQTQPPNLSANANSNIAGGQPNQHDAMPTAGKAFDKMRDSYPNLTQALLLLVGTDLEKALTAIDETKAQALDLKVSNLKKELSEAVMESATIQSTESSKIPCFPSTKLQPEFGAEIEKNFQLEHLDEMKGTQVKLARMEQEILELKQNFLAFQSQQMADSKQQHDKSSAKGIICESSESGLRSIVADNNILCNTLQKEMVVQQKLSCGKTKEEVQKMMYGQRKIPYGRKRNDAGSQIKRNGELRRVTMHGQQEDTNNEGGKEVLLLSTTRPHIPVAKATLQTSSGSKFVGGVPLGSEWYQVFVNDVLKPEAPLLRPPGMKMAEALKSIIAWPCAQIQWCNNGDPVKSGLPSHPGHWQSRFHV